VVLNRVAGATGQCYAGTHPVKSRRARRALAGAFGVACAAAALPASAQDTRWDSLLSNSSWYVPVPYLVATLSGGQSFTTPTPLAIGDQTLWALGSASNGAFTGNSSATLALGPVSSTSYSNMTGRVTPGGQIAIEFVPTTGGSPIIGIGQMREIAGVPLMEMQMITGTTVLVTHWAYMAPYNPTTFTPPPPQLFNPADVTSPQWRWTAGKTWRLVSPTLFGSTDPGTFKITNYTNGYFWGLGASPAGSTLGNFTEMGSITREGNVLFAVLGGGALTTLTGFITGDAATGTMALRPYDLDGPYGTASVAGLMPPSVIAPGMTWFASNLGSTLAPLFTGGRLQIDSDGQTHAEDFALGGAAGNTIDQRGNSAIFSGVFSDAVPGVPGSLTIANSENGGRIVLSGASTYTGPTTVETGATLVVDGSLVSPVTVAGTLRGTGLLGGTTTIAAGGVLAPGNSPGTLTFAAPVAMAPGATLQLDIDGTGAGAGNFSRVIVLGAANGFAAGGTLQPLLRGITGSATNSFTPALGQQFTVIAAQGGVSGSFAGLAQPAGLAPGTRLDALYAPTTVTLVATPVAYGNLAAAGLPQTANQSAVGRALDALRPAAGVRMGGASNALFAPLYALPGTALGDTLDQLTPSLYGDALLAARGAWHGYADQVSAQLAARRNGCAAGTCVAGPGGSTFWLNGFGQFASVNASAAPGFQTSLAGAMAGIDVPVDAGARLDARVGVAMGGASARTFAGNGATADGAAVQFALYGELGFGAFFLGGQAAWLLVDQATTRPLSAWGAATHGTASMSGGGGRVSAGLRHEPGGWRIEPTIGLSALALGAPATTEQAGAAPSLSIYGQSLTSVQSLISAPFSTRIMVDRGKSMTLGGLLGWSHEFADVAASTTAAFASLGGSAFSSTTAPIARDALVLGLSADLGIGRGMALYVGYQASLSSPETTQTVRGGFRMTW
jgi:autotransporter-associated beta strand protein